jgi:hypothetical protein
METLLVKIFATALALSQVTTAPDAVKTQFDRVRDQEQVAQLLHAGCTHMRKAFDIEHINLEELIATALDDPQAVGENKVFRGINFADLQMAYREFCNNERVLLARRPGGALDVVVRQSSGLRRRIRTRATLRHELIKLGFVLCHPKANEKVLKLPLLLFETPKGFLAIFVKGPIAARS